MIFLYRRLYLYLIDGNDDIFRRISEISICSN